MTPAAPEPAPAGLARRLVALCYDAVLVFPLLFTATALYLWASGRDVVEPGDWRLTACLTGVAFAYFTGCWSRYGRTPGMRAWGLRLEAADGARPGIGACALRFAAGLVSLLACGAGFAWALLDPRGLAWHDRWSRTKLVRRNASAPARAD